MLNEQQRRERERAVYDAMLALGQQGSDLSALTVKQIAEAAGMGKGTVYEYFSSKEEILQGLTVYCLDRELDVLEAALAPCATLSAAEDAALSYLEVLLRERIGVYQVVEQALRKSMQLLQHENVTRVNARLRGILTVLLDRLRAAGEISSSVDNSYGVFAVISACLTCTIAIMPCPGQPSGQHPTEEVFACTRRLLDTVLRSV